MYVLPSKLNSEPERLDLEAAICRVVVAASKANPRSGARIERLWQAISAAPFASNLDAFDHLVATLAMLDTTPARTLGFSLEMVVKEAGREVGSTIDRPTEHILTA